MTPAELMNVAETVEDDSIVVESGEYTDYELLEPGEYTSAVREVFVADKVTKTGVPFMSVEVKVATLMNENGEEITLSRPLRTWVSSLQFGKRNRPGTTSSLSEYLKACGFDPKQFGRTQTIEALGESATIPVKVRLERTNRTNKLADGTYEKELAYTSDFNMGTRDEPKYVAVLNPAELNEKQRERLAPIIKEGEFIKAVHKIGSRYDAGFRKI